MNKGDLSVIDQYLDAPTQSEQAQEALDALIELADEKRVKG